MRLRTSSSRISAPPPGMESRPASRRRAMVVRRSRFAVLGDGEDFRSGEAVEPDLREALLDAGEEALEPVDLQIGVEAALHEDAGAAHLVGLGDLLVDLLEVERCSPRRTGGWFCLL